MSKRQNTNQYNKYYHNDIKKQLGIDQSRTASQKLLDRAIKPEKRPDFYLTQNHTSQLNSQPKKKIKPNPQTQNQTPLSNLQILNNKLIKNIENQLNITKLLKSLTILKKCLHQQPFISDPQIDFKNNWKIYTDKLVNQITERNYCSAESFNIMTHIGDCIQILYNQFHLKNTSPIKEQQNSSNQIVKKQTQSNPNQTTNIWINFCRLFTDDSFIFHKNLRELKIYLFSQFDGTKQSSNQQKQLAINLIKKMVSMPIKVDWVHTALINLFKEFNNNFYQNKMEDCERKSYLKSYNQLLSKKPKSSVSDASYNIMGNSKQSGGLRTVHIEARVENGSDKWISKQ